MQTRTENEHRYLLWRTMMGDNTNPADNLDSDQKLTAESLADMQFELAEIGFGVAAVAMAAKKAKSQGDQA